jgi:hypothetical protein
MGIGSGDGERDVPMAMSASVSGFGEFPRSGHQEK